MLFTRLRITGFKSFVEPTELLIEPGLTGVVGPNGCGKSNLVEALGWVMGEGSAKKMRAKGMDDVIFAGTSSRPSRNMAEVALQVDNRSRRAPAAFNEQDDLEISRRIEREAGSVYRINGRETRARDVSLLFADAASGPHSTALVRQGRIGALIDAKPSDRRAILEEAAGIGGLHSRRHEAELRLRAAETNLTRLDDIMAQIEGQLAALKRQARQASRYRNLSGHIQRTEALLFYLRWQELNEVLTRAADMLEAAEAQVNAAAARNAAASNAQLKAGEAVPPLRKSEAEAAAALHRLTVARDGLAAEESRLAQQTERVAQALRQAEEDAARESRLLADSAAAHTRLVEEQAALNAAAEEQRGADSELRQQLAAAKTAVEQAEETLDQANRRLAEIRATGDSLKRELTQAEKRLAQSRQQVERTGRERQQAEAELARIADVQVSIDTAEAARSGLDAARASLTELEERYSLAQKREADAREAFHQAREIAGRLQAEEKALAKLLYSDEEDLWPPLVDALQVAPGYETALGAALGDDLNYPTDQAAPAFWKLVALQTPLPSLPDGVTPLGSFVSGADELVARLSQVGIIEPALGPALQPALLPGQRLVSLQGDLWRWDGLIAAAEAPTAAAKRLEMRNRHVELRDQFAAAAKTASGAEAVHREAAAQVQQLQQAEMAARKSARAAEDALSRALDAQSKAERASAALSAKRDSLMEAGERLALELAEAEAQFTAAEKAHATLESEAGPEQGVAQARTVLTERRAQLAQAQGALDGYERNARARAERLSAIGTEMQAWRKRQQDAEQQSEVLRDRAVQLTEELTHLQAQPDALKSQIAALLDQITQAEARRRVAADALQQAETAQADCDKEVRAAQEELSNLREERARCHAAGQNAAERAEDLAAQIAERLNCAPGDTLALAEVKDADTLPTLEKVEQDLTRFRRERENMGAVNLRADEEAEELRAQLDGMIREREDLEAAIARLRQAIASLNREGRERLLEAFESVNVHFTRLFTHLFGGGHARLELVESDDPLEAGLEILSSPPGKRLQSMSLLSGGEQALTAMALIFAVFLTNPSPICVLDEVDAPLDDANVERFCNLLHEMTRSTETRFLVITHNSVTMSHMDRLFGVTMAEKGVSQLVSVDLERAEKLRAVG